MSLKRFAMVKTPILEARRKWNTQQRARTAPAQREAAVVLGSSFAQSEMARGEYTLSRASSQRKI
jgi:hypothetical protein